MKVSSYAYCQSTWSALTSATSYWLSIVFLLLSQQTVTELYYGRPSVNFSNANHASATKDLLSERDVVAAKSHLFTTAE